MQYGRHVTLSTYRQHFKTRNIALNTRRRNEAVATDTVYANTPALGSGAKHAQIFVGHQSLVTDVLPARNGQDFATNLMENIRQRGAMDKLISDRAQEEVNHKMKEILRTLCIGDWQSEPYHEHQNPAERRYQTIKHAMNVTMDRTGAPPYMWFLCLAWVCAIYNSLATENLWDGKHRWKF